MGHPVAPTPRSFLITVHDPGSLVLEELSSGRRIHVTDPGRLGELLLAWPAEAPNGPSEPSDG